MQFDYDSNEIHHEVASDESIELLMNQHNPNNNEGAHFNEPEQQNPQQFPPQQLQKQQPPPQQQHPQQPMPSQPPYQQQYISQPHLSALQQQQMRQQQYQLQKQQQQQQQLYQPQPPQPQQAAGEKKSYAGLFGKGEKSLRKITDFAAPSDDEEEHHHQRPAPQRPAFDFQPNPYRTPYQEQVFQESRQHLDQRKDNIYQEQRQDKYMKLFANHFASVPSFAEAAMEANPSVDSKRKMTKKEMRKMLPPPPGKRQRRPKLYTTYFDDELDNERFYKNSESYFLNPARHTQFLNMNFVNREQHEQWDKMDVSTPDITISQRQAQIQFQHLQPQGQNKPYLTPYQQQQQQLNKFNPIQQKSSQTSQPQAQFQSQTQSQSQSQIRSVTPAPQRQMPPQRPQQPQFQQPQQQFSQQPQQQFQQQPQQFQQPQYQQPSATQNMQNQQQHPASAQQKQYIQSPSVTTSVIAAQPRQQQQNKPPSNPPPPQPRPQQEGPIEIPISDDEEVPVEQPGFYVDEEEGIEDEEVIDQEQEQEPPPDQENGMIQIQPVVQRRKELQQADAGRKTPGGKLTITYPDGSTRPFGKSFRQRGCEFGDPKKRQQYRREFVYFGGRTNGPTEHKLRKREEEKVGLSRVNPVQFNIPMPLEENRYWIPIKQLSDIPPTYYMGEKFAAATGVQLVSEQVVRTPYDAFKLFFDDDVYKSIIDHTKKKLAITPLMLDAYFAAQIYSGMLQLKDESLVSSKVSHLLDRQTYEQMRRCLRVSSEKKDRKVRELANHLNANFKKFYLPEEFIGLCASQETREYLVFDAVKMYTMEVKLLAEEPNDFDVACQLLEDYKGKFHKLVVDQFYSSPQLFTRMKQMKIGAVGTIKTEKVKGEQLTSLVLTDNAAAERDQGPALPKDLPALAGLRRVPLDRQQQHPRLLHRGERQGVRADLLVHRHHEELPAAEAAQQLDGEPVPDAAVHGVPLQQIQEQHGEAERAAAEEQAGQVVAAGDRPAFGDVGGERGDRAEEPAQREVEGVQQELPEGADPAADPPVQGAPDLDEPAVEEAVRLQAAHADRRRALGELRGVRRGDEVDVPGVHGGARSADRRVQAERPGLPEISPCVELGEGRGEQPVVAGDEQHQGAQVHLGGDQAAARQKGAAGVGQRQDPARDERVFESDPNAERDAGEPGGQRPPNGKVAISHKSLLAKS